MKKLIAIILMLNSALSGAQSLVDQAQGVRVSIIQLVATPERYDAKVVFLSAFATVEFENMSLCATSVTASHADCVWLEVDEGPYETAADAARYWKAVAKWKKFNHKRVFVRGTFNKENTGHLGGWSGALERITDVLPN